MSGSKTTFTKKEREQKKIKKRKGKEERKEERLASSSKGKGLEDMMAYVDENGNLSSVPPSLVKKQPEKQREYSPEIQNAEDDATERIGSVHFFNEQKGYGFIKDSKTNESIFVHINELKEPVKEKDKVSFQIKMRPKGPVAVEVKKIG